MQLANAEEDGGEKGGSDNEGLSTPDILNKLYQDVEKDFQVSPSLVWCICGRTGVMRNADACSPPTRYIRYLYHSTE